MSKALRETMRLSIEQCIREHLEQESDRDAAIQSAAREIVEIIIRPIDPLYEFKDINADCLLAMLESIPNRERNILASIIHRTSAG